MTKPVIITAHNIRLATDSEERKEKKRKRKERSISIQLVYLGGKKRG